MKITHCAIELLERTSPNYAAPICDSYLKISRAYMITITNSRSASYQKLQLQDLCLPLYTIVDFDTLTLSHRDLSCIFEDESFNMVKGKQSSSTIKMMAAVHHFVLSEQPSALIFEDDVLIHFERMQVLNNILHRLQNDFNIIHSSSYSLNGEDGQAHGFHNKSENYMKWRPTLMMPGAGNIISREGAKFIHSHFFPLTSEYAIDFALSNTRAASAPQSKVYILKPYMFTPGKFGKHSGIFGCKTKKCERKFYSENNFPSNRTLYAS